MNEKELIDQIAHFLDIEFGHLDFWQLSKKWKNIRYKSVAETIYHMMKDLNSQTKEEIQNG